MIVPSPEFLGFAIISAVIYHLVSASVWRQAVLLAVNLMFLATFSEKPAALLPFAGFLLLGYGALRLTQGGSRPFLFKMSLVSLVIIFCWLKHYSFIPSSLFLSFAYSVVGLSYVFFRVLHVIIDSHQGAIGNAVSLQRYVNYTLNFTSLVSGPIQRYEDYSRMEEAPSRLTLETLGRAVERVVIGYFKISVVAPMLLELHQHALNNVAAGSPAEQRVLYGALVIVAYPIFLYFNFSGYVDVVVGAARLFGIILPENFNRPFSSTNFLAFWSRWHMTLSDWLKTYVYNPLVIMGMERFGKSAIAQYVGVGGFFVTFFLVGVWHGQTSEFVFFGITQGGGVAVNKLYQITMAKQLGRRGYRALCANSVYSAFSRGLTFTWFALTLLWFWSNWSQIDQFVSALGSAGLIAVCLAIFVGATIVLTALETLRTFALGLTWSVDPGARESVLLSRYVRTAWSTALCAITAGANIIMGSPAPDIVYKTF